jgi:thiamine biosynthesis lipoprotein
MNRDHPINGKAALSRRTALAAVASLASLGAWPGAARAEGLLHRHRVLFGSLCEVLVQMPGPMPPTADLPQAIDELWRDLESMNARWNAWKPGEVTRLNQAIRERRALAVTPALRAVLQAATRLEQASSGFFNAGIGGVVGAWGFHDDVMRAGHRPSAALIERWRRQRPGLQQLEWRGGLVASRNPAVQVDLGGYAKGVAVDQALDRLRRRGVLHAVVNLGGNLATMGQGADGPWRIGIRDPFGAGLMAAVRTGPREAVVTSGSSERFRWLDGERCSHVIDPLDATPAPQLVSVTVAHPSAGVADAAATALLAAGSTRWQRVAESMGIDQAMVVDRDGCTTALARLASRLAFETPEWHSRLRVA